MTEAVVDANVLLRHLTGEPPVLAEQAGGVLESAERRGVRLVITVLTLAEVVWVLERSYRWPRPAIADGLTQVLASSTFHVPEAALLERALRWYRSRPRLHFADAYVAAVAADRGAAVVSFDRELKGLHEVVVVDSPRGFEA